jgi:hypothetical protein
MDVFANKTVFTDNTDGCFLIKQPPTKLGRLVGLTQAVLLKQKLKIMPPLTCQTLNLNP